MRPAGRPVDRVVTKAETEASWGFYNPLQQIDTIRKGLDNVLGSYKHLQHSISTEQRRYSIQRYPTPPHIRIDIVDINPPPHEAPIS